MKNRIPGVDNSKFKNRPNLILQHIRNDYKSYHMKVLLIHLWLRHKTFKTELDGNTVHLHILVFYLFIFILIFDKGHH